MSGVLWTTTACGQSAAVFVGIRVWRDMTLKAVADLVGISEGYLSRIERGERPVDRWSLLEAIAAALRVAPSELAEQAFRRRPRTRQPGRRRQR
ncbi:MAG TPA: helix-turn-helix transcriptional regulator [Pseudonocardiaceae bacterium]